MDGSSLAAPALAERSGPAELSVGFIPLVDSAVLVAAAEKGFAAANDLRLNLVRETSWANIRDRVMLGHFDAAQMLGPLPIASTLGIGGSLKTAMIAPFSLGFGGNAITVSAALWAELERLGAGLGDGPKDIAGKLAELVANRRSGNAEPLTFATVYPFSGHNYELRYWLASAGIDPDADIRMVVLPPPFMADALKEGQVDAFCVGEPWSSLAVDSGDGVIVATKSMLWRHGPEKVLGFRVRFADDSPERMAALLQALYRAAAWTDDAGNTDELADILARRQYVGTSPRIVRRALSGNMILKRGSDAVAMPEFIGFHRKAANFPWQSHALWYYSQMVRWGQVAHSAAAAESARRVFRPDLYRAALSVIGADLPNASAKVEGALGEPTPVASRLGKMVLGPDGFFDEIPFDPDDIEGYLRRFAADPGDR